MIDFSLDLERLASVLVSSRRDEKTFALNQDLTKEKPAQRKTWVLFFRAT
jgi:hypothetical protein